MTQPHPPKSLQDLIKRKQRSDFVGRDIPLAMFRTACKQEPDQREFFIFNVWGQGGVGKTTLLKQFRTLAEASQFATALTNDSDTSLTEAIARLAEQFAQQGHKLPQFTERHKVYRQKKQELETDPDAPQGFSALLGKSFAKAGMGLAKQIPGSGALTPFIDEDALASQASEWLTFAAKKLGNKDEVRLVQEPVAVLTPLWLQDLSKLAEMAGVVLFFDTYERTEDFLDQWLRDLLEGRYGALPVNLLLVIAGRNALNENHWADCNDVIARFPLDPFTETEATDYLTRKGITNPDVVNEILQLSGRLPLLVSTLAAANPNDPNQIGDPSGTAVDRFLKWVEDPQQRQVALDAALPHRLNQDIIAILHGDDHAADLFAWLTQLPFVEQRPDGWAYHDVVRQLMLRHKRLISPSAYATLHGKLADYYDQLRTNLHLEEKDQWSNDTWQTHALAHLYHRLCQAPHHHLFTALQECLTALKHEESLAQQWAATIQRVGEHEGTSEVQRWGSQLTTGFDAYANRWDIYRKDTESQGRLNCTKAVELFTVLLPLTGLTPAQQVQILGCRANVYESMDRYDDALNDRTRAIELEPTEAEQYSRRGVTYRRMECYEEALTDLNRAIALKSDDQWAIVRRGVTYRLMERYEEALTDLNRAIDLQPDYQWAIASRGVTYRLMERYEEALQDFNRAIELEPDEQWAIAHRGVTYCQMERYDEALEDLNRAIELEPDDQWVIVHRGETYCLMERYEEALQDFNHAIELEPDDQGVIASRGVTYLMLHQWEQALMDFNRAIELGLDTNEKEGFFCRALAYKGLGQADQATADFDRAIQLAQPKHDQNPQNARNTFNLALYHLAAGKGEQAKQVYQAGLDGGAPPSMVRMAIQDLAELLRVFPGHRLALSAKAWLEKQIG